MAKAKKQVTDSEKPIIQHDAFISKNKKRKEKRHLQNLTAKRVETGDFIPVKKNSLKPSPITGLSQKGKAQLSTSLPIKGSKKGKLDNLNHSIAVSASAANQSKKVTGILSNPNTPKRVRSKNEHVTFELSANTKKFIDEEAIEGEEPINDKVKKPPQKGLKKKLPVESSDESDSDDDIYGEDFLDMEASEGEETDSEDSDANLDGSSDGGDDVGYDENKYLSKFLNDEESESDDDGDNDEDDDDEDDDDSEDDDDIENTLIEVDAHKLKNQKVKNGPANAEKSKAKSAESETLPAKKGKLAEPKSEAKSNSFTPAKEEKVIAPKSEPKKMKKEQVKSEDSQVNEKVEKKNKKAETEVSKKEKFDKPSDFIGFIRRIPSTVTEKQIKTIISKIVAAEDVLKVVMVKARKTKEQQAFVYLKDSKSLGDLIHKKFDIGDSSFVVYRAKSSAEADSPLKSVAFLPRVPQWITEAELKQGVEKEIGVGKVNEIIEKKINKIRQTKNILVSFVDTDALKKAIQLGDFKIKDHTVIIREAAEGIKVPVYRAVLANIPEKTNEAAVKKILETSIGKNTVINVRFSFRKKSFAFIVFNDEEAMKKALALGDGLSVKGTKVEVRPYIPHKPRKRAPPSEQAKAKAAEKRKRKSASKTDGKQEQTSPKKMKTENASSASNASSLPSPNSPLTAKKKNKRKKSSIASPSGQVKATKNTKTSNNQKFSKAPSAPSPAKASKISPLKDKIQSKKEKFKGEISKQRKKGKK